MQNNDRLSREEIILLYQDDTMKLLKYLSWLQRMTGQNTSNFYKGEGIEEHSMAVPVFDSTLLSFVREAKNTVFMNRNYVYTFSQYRMNTPLPPIIAIVMASVIPTAAILLPNPLNSFFFILLLH